MGGSARPQEGLGSFSGPETVKGERRVGAALPGGRILPGCTFHSPGGLAALLGAHAPAPLLPTERGGMGRSKSTAHVNELTWRVRFKDPCVDNRNMPEDFRLGSEIINAFFEGRASVQCKKKRRALCMRRTSRGRGRDLSFASRGPGAAPGVFPADRHYLYFHEGKPDGQGNSKSGPKSHSKEVLWLCPCLATPHVHIQASGGRT